ncbi:GTPase activating protein, partial [Kappamyces sp. JEL0680]
SFEDGTNTYYVTDKVLSAPPSRWPAGLPQPPKDSPLFKIGEMGMGFLSQVLGSQTKNKIEDAGFTVLENFAQALEHPLARPLLPLIPEQVRSQFLSSAEAEALLNDYDSAQRYLAQFSQDITSRMGLRRATKSTEHLAITVDTTHDFVHLQQQYRSHFTGSPLTVEKWDSWFDEAGKLTVTPFYISCVVFCGGIEPQLRRTVWPRILKAVDWSQKDSVLCISDAGSYASIKASWTEVLKDAGNSSPRRAPTPPPGTVGDENEAADVVSRLMERHYRIDKDVARTDQTVPFYTMDPPLDNSKPLRECIDHCPHLVSLRNVLMTYTMFNFDLGGASDGLTLGYVQGMNDLCSPLLETIEDESDTFWSFVMLMERMVSAAGL